MKRALILSLLALPLAVSAYAAARLPGYLPPETAIDTKEIVQPPPAPGSLNESRDRSVFLSTRALQDSPRWKLAASDAVQTSTALTADFFCALGLSIDPIKSPALTRLLEKTMSDASVVTNRTKDFYGRQRPFQLYGGAICTEGDREGLMKSASYPSGHTTVSWAYGLILAELFPDKAAAVLARARSYGESRVICGVHTVSDVEGGRVNGSALIAALHADPGFQADFAAAKKEAEALRRSPPPLGERAAQCPMEAEAAAHRPW